MSIVRVVMRLFSECETWWWHTYVLFALCYCARVLCLTIRVALPLPRLFLNVSPNFLAICDCVRSSFCGVLVGGAAQLCVCVMSRSTVGVSVALDRSVLCPPYLCPCSAERTSDGLTGTTAAAAATADAGSATRLDFVDAATAVL